jgi:hypothetical protein
MKRAHNVVLLAVVAAGCAGGPEVDRAKCFYVRHEGMCEATVTLDPRESESSDEATTLEVRWAWVGDAIGEVPERIVRTHMTSRDARALAEAIDALGKSRCVVEQAIEPVQCLGLARIVTVEAEP